MTAHSLTDIDLPVTLPSIPDVSSIDAGALVDRAGSVTSGLVRRLPWVRSRRLVSRRQVVTVVALAALITVAVAFVKRRGDDADPVSSSTDAASDPFDRVA